jgi:hypothetical protein
LHWTITSTVKDKLGGTVQFNPAVTIVDGGRGKYLKTSQNEGISAFNLHSGIKRKAGVILSAFGTISSRTVPVGHG